MSLELVQSVLELLFFPIAIALVVWAVTQRRSDNAAIKKTLAEAIKVDAEAEVAKETVEAAVQLADITTLQQSIVTMGTAFKEERESLERELVRCSQTARTALDRQEALAAELDDMRADVTRYHREVLDMYRRDLYQNRAMQIYAEWINDNVPKLIQHIADIPKPPQIDPLPPLHISIEDEIPARRWYDSEPAVDPADQEI